MWLLVLFPLAASAVGLDKHRCPSELFQDLGSKCYLDVFNQPWSELAKPATFADAFQVCRSFERSSLPFVANKVENGILRTATDDVWIGLTWLNPRRNSNTTGQFEALRNGCQQSLCWTDGTELGAYSELKTDVTTTERLEQCAVLSVSTGQWYLDNCTSTHDYFCELPAKLAQMMEAPAPDCSGHGRQVCQCDAGFSGDTCQISEKYSRLIRRCWRFMPKDPGMAASFEGVEEGCDPGEVCVPDDLDCFEDKECDNPIGWCLPKK